MSSGLQHGVIRPAEPYGLPLDFTTLPEKLKKAGKAFFSSLLSCNWRFIVNNLTL